jgi:class 3 adenylate cyclase
MNTSSVSPQIQRTLAAIVVTDAVGFSKRMSQDEDKALAMINRDLRLISELCEFFEGQILKTVGDGVLMYFVSAVQAAACAVEMQKTFASFAKSGQADEHFTHRVGVHLGDIFFNQQDMMGTGVNIAARLESAAKPGAICMSQVVYDVVKSRLELDALYIGQLSLKNIEDAIAAYHVWPKGMRPAEETTKGGEEKPEETTEAVAPLTVSPTNVALKILSEHPNSRRIKKLLYGTHQGFWENDTTVLEGFSLKLLLESLTERNSSLNECRSSLYQIVCTLNRQDEYTQVAEAILESIKAIYAEPVEGISAELELEQGGDSLLEDPMSALYGDISRRLNHTTEPIRMKKMLYCLCYDSWENNSDRIVQIDTLTLVAELYQQITTIQGLQNRLRTILLRLNRKAKYAPIANLIFKECQALYPEANSQISMPGAADMEDSEADNTQINLRKKPAQRWIATKQASGTPVIAPVLVPSAVFGN